MVLILDYLYMEKIEFLTQYHTVPIYLSSAILVLQVRSGVTSCPSVGETTIFEEAFDSKSLASHPLRRWSPWSD